MLSPYQDIGNSASLPWSPIDNTKPIQRACETGIKERRAVCIHVGRNLDAALFARRKGLRRLIATSTRCCPFFFIHSARVFYSTARRNKARAKRACGYIYSMRPSREIEPWELKGGKGALNSPRGCRRDPAAERFPDFD